MIPTSDLTRKEIEEFPQIVAKYLNTAWITEETRIKLLNRLAEICDMAKTKCRYKD